MNYTKHPFLRTITAALALALAAATAQAQQANDKTTTDPQSAAPASAGGRVEGDTTARGQDSSDQNVPPATARKQAAEVAAGDPPRWYREDTTPAARLRTMQKEAAAGLQEAQGNCRRQPTAERASCLKEARAIYQKEMAEARSKAMDPAR